MNNFSDGEAFTNTNFKKFFFGQRDLDKPREKTEAEKKRTAGGIQPVPSFGPG